MGDATRPSVYPLWSDTPAARDLLGYTDIAVAVIDAIRREGLDPVAIGVFGSWGSGKSTILELVAAKLPKDTITVRVRPWEYDKADDPKALLITEVLDQLERALSKRDKLTDAAKKTLRDLAGRVNWTRALTLAAKGVMLQVPSISDLARVFNEKPGDAGGSPSMSAFRAQFEELLDTLPDIERVAVLVDDLDRCLPPAVLATLEAVKLFLSVPKMAFVIFADDDLVTLALAPTYGGSTEARRLARLYLEKIVQIPVRVPALGPADTEAYLGVLLIEPLVDERTLAAVIQACATARGAGKETLLPTVISDATEEVKSRLVLARALARVLARTTSGNPRRLKRFLNAYWIRADVARRRGITLKPDALAKFMVLEETMPASFRTVLGWLDEGTLATNIKSLERDPSKTADADLVAWSELAPKLEGADVAPYLRLAASFRAAPPAAAALRADLQVILEEGRSGTLGTRRRAQTAAKGLGQDDRRALTAAIAESICAAPDDQGYLGETLAAIVGADDSLAQVAADGLEALPASRVEPAIVVHLGAASGAIRAPFRALFEKWFKSGDLPDKARVAIRQSLEAETQQPQRRRN